MACLCISLILAIGSFVLVLYSFYLYCFPVVVYDLLYCFPVNDIDDGLMLILVFLLTNSGYANELYIRLLLLIWLLLILLFILLLLLKIKLLLWL